MASILDMALIAGASYNDTRSPINRFPVPQGWTLYSAVPSDGSTGFEARSFQNGGEIVISFAGTYTGQLGDLAADANLGSGAMHPQLLQAIEYYLQVKAANPAAAITLTGHSLGGGLASLVAVFFGVPAQTFDQAPFAPAARNLGVSLYVTLLGKGYSAAVLAPLNDFNIAMLSTVGGAISNSGYVTNINVQGELLSPFAGNRIGSTLQDISNTSPGVSSNELHSQALLAAFLQSKETAPTGKALNEVTVKLTDLLKMIFDKNLFAADTDPESGKRNFLEHLVRHEAGVQGSFNADAMVTRFTADLWKLAQDGGLTMTDGNPISSQFKDVSKTLMAFAMQKYYEETSASVGYGSKLFSDVTGGVQFDILDVSTKFATAITNNQKLDLNDAKGYKEYFKNYLLQGGVTSAERSLIQSMLPACATGTCRRAQSAWPTPTTWTGAPSCSVAPPATPW
jgi:Lipase (class 3)